MTRPTPERLKEIRDILNSGSSICHYESINLLKEIDALIMERDLAIAHDRQPYPTANAYEQACKALDKYRERHAKLKKALLKIYDPLIYHHWEEDPYTRAGCFQHVAQESLTEDTLNQYDK